MKYILTTLIVLLGVIAVVEVTSPVDPMTFGSTDFNRIESGVTNTSVSISTSSATTALAANSARVYAALINDSANTVYCNLGSNATTSRGIRLNASGGSYEITPDNLYIGIVTCIATTDTSTLTTVEK